VSMWFVLSSVYQFLQLSYRPEVSDVFQCHFLSKRVPHFIMKTEAV